MNNRALYERGKRTRRQVLGEKRENEIKATEDEFSMPIREFTTKYVWGEVWSSKGLPRRTRSLINVALLTSLMSPHELKTHLRAARINGCTKAEIREVLLQVAVYCGVPVVREAVRCAQEVFAEEKNK
jgi:4-carboxymuconolactone decarboxylase